MAYAEKTGRPATARRCGKAFAAICAASLLSCHTAPGPLKPEADCEPRITSEAEQKLRMDSSCWEEMPLLPRSELSAMLKTAAKGDARAVAEIPKANEPGRIIRSANEALVFLRNDGAKEIHVLQHARGAKVVDGSEALARLRALYSGTEVEPLIRRFPPLAVEVRFDSGFESEEEKAFAGKYFPGTNLWVINPKGAVHNQVSFEQVAAHELLHYLSWLSHGGVYYYLGSDSRGRFLAMDRSMWLEEGLASLISYNLAAGDWEKVPYPHFTASALVLEKIAGSKALASALLSGDLRAIQERFEGSSGGMSFHELVSGSLLLGPAYVPLMKARAQDVLFLDEVRRDRILRKICESPPKDFDCGL